MKQIRVTLLNLVIYFYWVFFFKLSVSLQNKDSLVVLTVGGTTEILAQNKDVETVGNIPAVASLNEGRKKLHTHTKNGICWTKITEIDYKTICKLSDENLEDYVIFQGIITVDCKVASTHEHPVIFVIRV